MNINKLKKVILRKDILQKDIAEQLGLSPGAFGQVLRRGDLKVSMLENVSEILGVSPCIFLEDELTKKIIGDYAQIGEGNINYNNNSHANDDGLLFQYKSKIELLEERCKGFEIQVASQKAQLESKNEIIEMLKSQK